MMRIINFLLKILKDERGSTLTFTYSFSANTLIVASQMNQNFDDAAAVVNALTATNYADDSVGKAALASDVIRTSYGLVQHTDGSLYIDVSDTNPGLEISDGGIRAKVDDSSIERASGGLQVKALGITAAMLAGSIPDSKLNQLTTANKVANTALVAITAANKVNMSSLYGTGYLPDDTVDTTALKTATGEISTTGTKLNGTLPGGTYGFYTQHKVNTGTGYANVIEYTGTAIGSTYYTPIFLNASGTMYAQQRYVTASGTDWFVYLKIDKTTKEIVSLSSAPDHVSYGNSGDYEKIPHPFGNVDLNKYEIVLLDKETIFQLQAESIDIDEETGTKRLATLINENYKVNLTKKEPYIPLHSGKYKKTLENGQEVVIKHMIKTIPDFISVRKLTKLTQAEKDEREAKQEAQRIESDQKKQVKENNRITAKTKLESLLTKEEVNAMFE